MAANSYTQWQYLTPMGVGAPGAPPQQPAGGNPPPQVFFRDSLDAAREGRSDLGTGYPDGYLSTIRSRREDAPGTDRENQRAYQRGVHKGERIDPQDYQWPTKLSLSSGIERQMKAAAMEVPAPRYSPLYPIIPAMSPKEMAVQGVDSGIGVAAAELRRYAPPYR